MVRPVAGIARERVVSGLPRWMFRPRATVGGGRTVVESAIERHLLEVACYDETELGEHGTELGAGRVPLWTASGNEFKFETRGDPYAAVHNAGQQAICVLDSYTSKFFWIDVRTRAVSELPNAPHSNLRTPAVACCGDWFWVTGGSQLGCSTRVLDAFDLRAGLWRTISDLPISVAGHTLTALPDTTVPNARQHAPNELSSVQLSFVTSKSYDEKRPLRIHDDIKSGWAVLAGGVTGDEDDEDKPDRIISDVILLQMEYGEVEQPILITWRRLPSMRDARSRHGAALVGNKLVVAGGCRPDPNNPDRLISLRTVECLDLAHPEAGWSFLSELPPTAPSVGIALVNLNHQLLAAGGVNLDLVPTNPASQSQSQLQSKSPSQSQSQSQSSSAAASGASASSAPGLYAHQSDAASAAQPVAAASALNLSAMASSAASASASHCAPSKMSAKAAPVVYSLPIAAVIPSGFPSRASHPAGSTVAADAPVVQPSTDGWRSRVIAGDFSCPFDMSLVVLPCPP